jgi:iron complex transport system substrate-binding protein
MQTALLISALLLCACGDTPARSARGYVVDDLGREVSVADSVTRVISLLPAATQMIHALGSADKLVARIDDDLAGEISSLPSIGLVLSPSIERILSLHPDLVIAWAGAASVVERLEAAHVTVYAARIERLRDVGSSIRRIGRLLGRGTVADSLARQIDRDLESLRRVNMQKDRPSVLYVIQTDPLWSAGPNTFITDLIDAAGGANVFADLAAEWSHVSIEMLLARQPDVVIVPNARAATILGKQPGWMALNAVRSGKVFVADPAIFNQPGPQITRAARQLSALLHGDTDK